MPISVENCVSSLLKKWRDKPGSMPKKTKDGKLVKTSKQKTSLAWAICQSSITQEKSTLTIEEVPFDNPVMTGIGATNRPHLMGLGEVTVIEQDGKELLKIPLLILGRWLHRTGILNFTQEFVNNIMRNLEDDVAGHRIAWDCRHLPELGAFAWVKSLMQEGRSDGKVQVSALAEPTPAGRKAVEEGRFRYASIEFQPNFQDRRAATLSFEGEDDKLVLLEEGEEPVGIVSQDLEEGDMPKEQEITLEQFEEMQVKLQEMEQAAGRATELEQQLEQVQARAARLEQMALDQYVSAVIVRAEAYRDTEQRAHPKVFLEWLASVMKSQPIGEEDTAIKLEAEDATAAHVYYRKTAAWLAENLPGAVPMSAPQTEPDKTRPIDSEDPTKLSADAASELDEVLGIVGSAGAASLGGE